MSVLLSQQSNLSITPKKWCTVPVWKHKKQIFMSKLKHSPDYMGSRRWVCLLFLSVLALDYTHISHDNIILLVHWINFEPLNMNDGGGKRKKKKSFFVHFYNSYENQNRFGITKKESYTCKILFHFAAEQVLLVIWAGLTLWEYLEPSLLLHL